MSNTNTVRFGNVSCNYVDNRYWTMWKLPMFGCQDGEQGAHRCCCCCRARQLYHFHARAWLACS